MCTKNELHIILKLMAKAYRDIYGKKLVTVLLYGSYARGDYEKDSDIDIVAIVHGNRLELQNKLKEIWDISADLEVEYGTIVSPTVIPYEEFEKYKKYRLEMAEERLHSSKVLLEAGSYKDSIGRSYYAMFTAVRALLAMEGQDFSKHAGVIAYFQKEFVKTGKVDRKYSKYISQAFQIRNNTDYADFFIVSAQDAKEQYEKAKEFLKVIVKYLSENY